ncbi:MAG: cobalt-precorrin-6A reductase [Cyanobacteria bacterium J06627_8]
MKRLWLIGGTHESRILAERLVEAKRPTVVTMTTESARSLYPPSPLLVLFVGRLSSATLPAFLHQHSVGAILDASHPFAVQISELAIAVAQSNTIPYLRFERPSVSEAMSSEATSKPSAEATPTHHLVPSIDELINSDRLLNQRVLLTLGYRWLPYFQSWQSETTLFARILPSLDALSTALDAGFTSDRLIALRPPISAEFEKALWTQWQISMVVTKASGAPGGEAIKHRVAKELGIKLITIARPPIAYPAQTQNIEEAIAFSLALGTT